MAAEGNAVLNLITKAGTVVQQIGDGWYKASQAMRTFPFKLAELEQKAKMYPSLLKRYGMGSDPLIVPMLQEATRLLDEEKARLHRVQASCCLGRGRKLLFPESVITALDNVIAAFGSLPQKIQEREDLTQQLEKATLSKVRLLPFSHDPKYVPLEASVLAVKTALESETTDRIVAISGGPGQGKSSMAKYIACLYQDGIGGPVNPSQSGNGEASSSQNSPRKRFQDGVVFLKCGTNVNTKGLLLQLWQDMGYKALPSSTNKEDQASSYDGMELPLQDEESILRQLSARLKDQEVLIIFDDVWESTTLDKLIAQGEKVKFLITTQIAKLRADASEIPINRPTLQEANCILANHVGYDPKEVSADVQIEIREIIEGSDHNPLILANIATNIRKEKASEPQEWSSTRRYLSDLQNGDEKRPVTLYGRTYSKQTMGASMEMAVNSFSNEEQTLVFLASMFESEPIPQVVFELAFKSLHSSLAKFSRSSQHLETSNFVLIESQKTEWNTIPRRSWSIHTMRQNFVLKIKEEEIALMFSKLCGQIKYVDIVAILLVVYGRVSWRDQAASKLGISTIGSENHNSRLDLVKPFVWLLHADYKEGWEEHSHQLAKQVLLKYLRIGELDEVIISELLSMQETVFDVSEALSKIITTQELPPRMVIESPRVLELLVNNLACVSKPQLQHQATKLFSLLCQLSQENAINIVSFPLAMEKLVGFLEKDISPQLQEAAGEALGYISRNVKNAAKIGSSPHAVERLVGLLEGGVRPIIQENAAWALAQISQCVQNATMIGSFPHAVERLVGLLEEGVKPEAQRYAAWALGQISQNVVENATMIGSFPHAVERLVGLLEEGVEPEAQKDAAWALGQISQCVKIATMIGSFPHAVERLVGLLEEGVEPEAQIAATWALGQISRTLPQADEA